MDEPLIKYKCGQRGTDRKNGPARPGRITASEYRYAVEQALRYRRPRAVLIDEAQHLAKMASGRRLLDQLDVIKSIASQTNTVHVLCGTYWAEQAHDRRAFLAVLRSFERQLPLSKQPDLVAEWEYLYEGSL